MNLQSLDWDEQILDAFEIPRPMLPRIRSSSEIYGYTQIVGIRDVPIAPDLGNHQLLAKPALKPDRRRIPTEPVASCS